MTAAVSLTPSTYTATPISDALAKSAGFGYMPIPDIESENDDGWQSEVQSQIERIKALSEDWDGYGAGPVRNDVMKFAAQVLQNIMHLSTPAPKLTPMSNEGLMLEWHIHGIDLEVDIERPGTMWMSFEDSVEHIDEEGEVRANLRPLWLPIEKLTKRATLQNSR